MRTRPAAAVLFTALLAAAGCGGGSEVEDVGAAPTRPTSTSAPASPARPTTTTVPTTPSTTAAPAAPTTTAPPPAPSTTAPPALTTVTLWFLLAEELVPVPTTVPAVEGIGAQAVNALLAGPGSSGGYTTAIPPDTRLLGLDIDGGVATVDLSSEFESGGGSLSVSLRIGQVVCTLDAFPTVDGVLFHLDGEPVSVFSGEGVVLDGPVACSDYLDGSDGAAEDGFAVANAVESFLAARQAGSGAEAWLTEDAVGSYEADPADPLVLYGVTQWSIAAIDGSGPYQVRVDVDGDGGPRTEVLTVRDGLAADGTRRDHLVVAAALG